MSDKHVVAALQRSVADLEVRLIEVVRERDQAYDDRNRARAERDLVRSAWAGAEESLVAEREHAERLANERDEARAEHEVLRQDAVRSAIAMRDALDGLEAVAERQREACAEAAFPPSRERVRATPLVTEDDK